MKKEELWVIKLGGKTLEDEVSMRSFVKVLSELEQAFILVHGGGIHATQLADKLGVPQRMVEGRRITDAETLDIALMSYAGLLNKRLVSRFQAAGINAIGLTGADGNAIPAQKREVKEIDYGFVGDPILSKVNTGLFTNLLEMGMSPVLCALSHDEQGQMLNTNADTMAQIVASTMSDSYQVKLLYLFEMKGVLRDKADNSSLINRITLPDIEELIKEGIISDGMIPKLNNAKEAVNAGVESVIIGSIDELDLILNKQNGVATQIVR